MPHGQPRISLMARLPRLVIPGQMHCILQRGNDRQQVFRDDADYQAFHRWLREAANRFRVAVHAYAFLPNQVCILATPSDAGGLGQMMQWLGRYYVPYFNQRYGRTGTLWEGRYRAAVVDAHAYFLACSVYIELSPVRAGLANAPDAYVWSSYLHHIGLKPDPLITAHSLYWALGNTPFERELTYRDRVVAGLSSQELTNIGEALQKGKALARDNFVRELERQSGQRLSPAKRGRPRKPVLAVQANENKDLSKGHAPD